MAAAIDSNTVTMAAPQVLAQAKALGVVLTLSDGELRAKGSKAGIEQLAQHIRACKPEIVKLLASPPAVVAPAPDPGMAPLLALAMTYCNHTGASDKARADWHADIEATPVEQRGELAAHLRSQLPAPSLKAMPPAVVASPSPPAPAQTWREADKADQLHYWGCAQCLPVVKTGTGKRCTTGQQLHDAYMDAATREGRFIGAAPDPAKPLPKFHHAQPWRAIDRELQAHHWSCAVCKAAARGHSERCPTGQHQHGLYESFVNAP